MAVQDIEAPHEEEVVDGVTRPKFGSWWRTSSDNKRRREAMDEKRKSSDGFSLKEETGFALLLV